MKYATIGALKPLLFALATLAGSGMAQDAAGEFHISGIVVNSATDAPVAQALVSVQQMPIPRQSFGTGSRPLSLAALTDAAGRFRFDTLQAGTYSYTANKIGFSREEGRAAQQAIVGPSQDALVIRLTPLAKIHGKITDIDGEPVPGISVRALHAQIQDGRRVFRQDRSVTTGDQGEYRMWNFEPGDYYVVAAGRSGGTVVVVGPAPASGLAHEGFEPVYYPKAADRGSAAVISLTPGQEFEANLKINLQPAYRVSGTLRNLAPYQPVRVELLRGPNEISSNRVVVNGPTGRFEVSDVVPGSYLLRAMQRSGQTELRAEIPIQVARTNLEGVLLELLPGVTVSGVVRDTGAGTSRGRGERDVRCHLTLVPSGNDGSAHDLSAIVDDDGKFAIENVPAGKYRLETMAFASYVGSAVSGSIDLLAGELEVARGTTPAPIEIMLRRDTGTIHGKVETALDAGQVIWVLLVRHDGSYVNKAPSAGQTFELAFVAPGDYIVHLVKDLDNVEYRNPEVVQTLRGGEKVHVTPGGDAAVVLRGASR